MALMATDNGGQGGNGGGGRQRGLLLGRGINLRPDPPAKDLLEGPLAVDKLPEIELPQESITDRLSAFLFRTVLGYREGEYHTMRELRQTTAAVMASVSKVAARDLENMGWSLSERGKTPQQVVRLTHPDQLLDAFLTMILAPEALRTDSQTLEVLLAVVLRNYIKEMSEMMGTKFSFEAEAHSHCMLAYEQERQIKNVVDNYERMAVLQQIYNAYTYTANYYLYSLVAREALEHGDKMFSMYIRAVFFISRLQYDGTLLEHVNRRRLPLRREVMFRVKRDRPLQQRYGKDEEFANQIKNILSFFPST